MANPGKNKIMRFARMYVDAYNISGDSRTFGSLGVGYGEVDLTGWDNTIRQLLTDKQLEAAISDYQALINDTDPGGSFTQLKNPTAGREVSILFGGNAEPEFGDPAYLLASAQMSSNTNFDSKAGVISATFRADTVDNNEWPIGHVIHPETSIAITTTGDPLDNGEATALGWHAIIHIIASDAGTWVLEVQHSTDDISYSTLGTFVLDGSVIGSEHIGGTGTVNQYVAVELTRTSGTITPVVTFARNK